MTTEELYTCTECGELCDPNTQKIHRHSEGMMHLTCPGPSIALQIAKQFWAVRKRCAPKFGQTISVPDWEELPDGLQALTVAAIQAGLNDWHIRRRG